MIGSKRASPLIVSLGLATIYLVWGTTYLAIRVAIESIPPFFLSGTRYIIAGTLLFGWVMLRGGTHIAWPARRHWLAAAVSGSVMIAFGNGVLSWAEQWVPSGLAAVLYAAPLWLGLLARIVLGERIGRWTIGGLVVGFVGIVVLVGPGSTAPHEIFPMVAVTLAAAGWALGAVLSRRLPLPASALQVAGMQMFSGGAVSLAISVANGDAGRFRLGEVSSRSELAFIYLVFIGAILGFGVFAWLIKSAPISLVATYGYVNPIVAVIIGSILLHEALGPRELIGGAVVIGGVALIVSAQSHNWGEPAMVS